MKPSDILGVFADPDKLPEILDRELVENLLPELSNSTNPVDHVRQATALEAVRKHRHRLLDSIMGGMRTLREINAKDREQITAAKAKAVATELKNQELQSELRALRDGRGIYESKTKTELEAKIAQRDRLLEQEKQLTTTLQDSVQSLQAELRGRLAMVQQYEISVSQLTTAAAGAAEAARRERAEQNAIITAARLQLNEARDNIDARYGHQKLPAFIEAIRNDIVAALVKLPPVS